MPEGKMKPTPFQVHKSWLVPTALVLAVTGAADCAAVWFAHRPILWAALIGASLPISLSVFVIVPMVRQERRRS
jgi:hypothetical protein